MRNWDRVIKGRTMRGDWGGEKNRKGGLFSLKKKGGLTN